MCLECSASTNNKFLNLENNKLSSLDGVTFATDSM
jgi:hypothetical protein